MKRAFSLIEILIGLGLFAMLGTVSTVMLLSSLRGARKAAAINIAKNEGQYALNAMSQMARFAKSANCGDISGNVLTLTKTDDSEVLYGLLPTRKIASDSANLTSDKVSVTACGDYMFTCDTDGRTVNICFDIDTANAADVSETAGIRFNTTIVLRNWGN